MGSAVARGVSHSVSKTTAHGRAVGQCAYRHCTHMREVSKPCPFPAPGHVWRWDWERGFAERRVQGTPEMEGFEHTPGVGAHWGPTRKGGRGRAAIRARARCLLFAIATLVLGPRSVPSNGRAGGGGAAPGNIVGIAVSAGRAPPAPPWQHAREFIERCEAACPADRRYPVPTPRAARGNARPPPWCGLGAKITHTPLSYWVACRGARCWAAVGRRGGHALALAFDRAPHPPTCR